MKVVRRIAVLLIATVILIASVVVGCLHQTVPLPDPLSAITLHRPITADGVALASADREWVHSLLRSCWWSAPLYTPPVPELAIELVPVEGASVLVDVLGSTLYASSDEGVGICEIAPAESSRLARLSEAAAG